jgi:hypothetical protein
MWLSYTEASTLLLTKQALSPPPSGGAPRIPSRLLVRWTRPGFTAQMIHGHGHVEVEVRVHAQDRLGLGGVRPFDGVDDRHVCAAPFDIAVTFKPRGSRERTILCVATSEASSYEVTMLLRPRVAYGRHQGVRPTSHLQGTFGSRGRRVRPLRGVAYCHPPGYSQRGRTIPGIFWAFDWRYSTCSRG